jgi:hypothetical protein
MMKFKEEFLCFIWQFRLIQHAKLQTTLGEPLEIIHCGFPNSHAGPDFYDVKIKVGSTIWVGNVEIHVKSSDWHVHGHQINKAYDNVVLHVVLVDDSPVSRLDGTLIPTLIVKDLYPQSLVDRYKSLMTTKQYFPCESQISTVDQIVVHSWLSRVVVERYESKYVEVCAILKQNKGDWDATLYFLLARGFGFKVNNAPFEMLARSLNHQLFHKYKDNPVQIEALIFGQAGFLSGDFQERYPVQLQSEYEFLKKKFNLKPMEVSVWKFLRMRPGSFPTKRLAQFAGLMIKSQHLFSKILEAENLQAIKSEFEALQIHAYWSNHYHFGATSVVSKTQLGALSIENLIINTVCLILFCYGKALDFPFYMDQAFNILEQLQGENNSIVNRYSNSGIKIETALVSQALLELNKNYCARKKCLNCGIGIKILRS